MTPYETRSMRELAALISNTHATELLTGTVILPAQSENGTPTQRGTHLMRGGSGLFPMKASIIVYAADGR
jgi:hypothetical protein